MRAGDLKNELRATELAGQAHGYIWRNKGDWVWAALLPGIVLVLLQIGIAMLPAEQRLNPGSGSYGARDLAAAIAETIAISVFAVAWHRFILLKELPTALPAIGGYHVKFAVMSVFLTFIAAAPGFILFMLIAIVSGGRLNQGSGILIVILVAVVVAYIFLRFCLVFPIVAIQGKKPLADSFELTSKRVFKLFWAFALGMLPVVIAGLVIGLAVGALLVSSSPFGRSSLSDPTSIASIAMIVAETVMTLYGSAVMVGVASGAYRRLTQEER